MSSGDHWMSSRVWAIALKASIGPASRPARSRDLNIREDFTILFIGFLVIDYCWCFMPQQFWGNNMKITEWRRMDIPSFGDGKLIRAGLFFLNETPFTWN